MPSKLNFRSCLVTGGSGYTGHRVVQELLRRGVQRVHVFDIRPVDLRSVRQDILKKYQQRTVFFKGDIREYSDVQQAMQGCDVVFHVASYGLSGAEMLSSEDLIYDINVKGTENVLRACVELGVERLVYTSSVNAVFCGRPIHNEHVPEPLAPNLFTDPYSRSKAIAERLVLVCNGLPLPSETSVRTLRTCALRSAGIYGEDEERHFTRIVGLIQRGMFVRIGGPDVRIEWTYIDNLVHAHLLAADRLADTDSCVAGKAYAITDQEPINNFDFMRPLVEGLGRHWPSYTLPVAPMVALAYASEIVHVLCRTVGLPAPGPFLTVTEVYKCAVTHYFPAEPAQRELGYRPVVRGRTARRRLVQAWQSRLAVPLHTATPSSGRPHAGLYLRAAGLVLMRALTLLLIAARVMLLFML